MKRQLNRAVRKLVLLSALLAFANPAPAAQPKRLLVVSVTMGYRHSSIEIANRVLTQLGEKDGGFTIVDGVDTGPRPKEKTPEEGPWLERTRQMLAAKMNATALKQYDGVIFVNTTLELPMANPQDLIDYVNAGHAFIGMHSASDTFHNFAPYVDMLGGDFLTHGSQATVECLIQDHQHPATRDFIGDSFWVHDEIYILKNFHRERVHGLLTLDKHPNTGMPGDYPIAWCKQIGKGRLFYTSLGHREDVWDNLSYQKHITGGIRWALGLERGDARPQSTTAKLCRTEARDGFRPLFNGVDLQGWHLRKPDGPRSWSAQNGMLVNEIAKDQHGTDLVSNEKFRDFTVRCEFMVPKGSNSGLYLRGRHEIQILEDFGVTDLKPGNNGGIYSIQAPPRNVSRRAGQWQEMEATIRGDRVSVTLNGVKIHDNVEVTKATGGELDRDLDQPGPILLQGDHGAIAFRNLRIKPLTH